MNRPDTARWREMVNRLDKLVTPRANAFVRTSVFADLIAAMTRLEVQMRRQIERNTARIWNLWNLPTASEQRRIRAQLTVIEARLRDLAQQLEEQEREDQGDEG